MSRFSCIACECGNANSGSVTGDGEGRVLDDEDAERLLLRSHAERGNEDGTAFDGGDAPADNSSPGFSFTPDDNATYVVTLTVSDSFGNSSTTSTTIPVGNADPVVEIVGAPASGRVGDPILLSSSVTDPGFADTFNYFWSVSRNGAPFASGGTPNLSFTPDSSGVYAVTLTVFDDDGGRGSASDSILVDRKSTRLNSSHRL